MTFNQKTVLVIGGCHGIGAGIVKVLAEEGNKVIFSYRSRKDDAINLQNELNNKGCSVQAMYGDFSSEKDISEFLDRIETVHVVVINAAVNHKESFLSYSVDDLNSIIKNNLSMPFMFCQKIAIKWIHAGIPGKIINITSIRGESPQLGRVGYCCSKAALNMLTKCAAYELAEYGITVNAVAIGLTGLGMNQELAKNPNQTWINRERKIPLGRTGNGNDIGNVVTFLSNQKNDWITGQIITVDGGHQLVTF